MPKLSIIILSYNTRDITFACLESLVNSLQPVTSFKTEIIVIDNASSDGSQKMIQSVESNNSNKDIIFKTKFNTENRGYPKGNNQGVQMAEGEYILFLNSDVMMKQIIWEQIVTYMDEHQNTGALTVRVELPNGDIDPASHRGFPTVWNAFSYFSKLETTTRPFPFVNKMFGGYHLTHLPLKKIHKIDSPSGAFFLTRKSILEKLGGFDETFFMYGEDLDLAFRIKQEGYDIIYYPDHSVLHLKYQSGLKGNNDTKQKTKQYFYEAMEIFYKKHYEKQNSKIINLFVNAFISIKKKLP